MMRPLYFVFVFLLAPIQWVVASMDCETINYCTANQQTPCGCPIGCSRLDEGFYLKEISTSAQSYRCIPSIAGTAPNVGLAAVASYQISNSLEKLSSSPRKNCPCEENRTDLSTEGCLPPFARVIEQYPKGCKYVWEGFNLKAYRETVRAAIHSRRIPCGGEHHAMCTSATFLAFIEVIKNLRDTHVISESDFLKWSDLDGPAWKFINAQARPDLLVENLKRSDGKNLGIAKTLRRPEIPVEGWPRAGDFVQIWRENNSGHAVLFQGYLKNASGKTVGICYWSANSSKSTDGYGKRCEALESIKTLIAARIEGA